ncbi:MAG: MFS transporter, partial [Myxococcota bacterium]
MAGADHGSWGLISAGFLFTGSIAWGPVAAAFDCTDAEFTFYLLRFVLGIAEAGFVPGVLLYLTQWFPAARRGQVIALFFLAIPISNVIGGPISGAILEFLDGAGALRGWQWLFVIEGLPTVLFGFVFLRLLPDAPGKARWLGDAERALIAGQLAEDERQKAAFAQRFTLTEVFTDWRVWALALADFSRGVFNNALNFWMPTLVQELGVAKDDYFTVGLLTMIPWGTAALAMVLCAWNSDRTGDRLWHAVLAALAAAAGLVILAFVGRDPVLSL